MPRSPSLNPPRYRRQKGPPVDRAFTECAGRRFYLGAWNSPESHAAYKRFIAEWKSNERAPVAAVEDLTVVELCARFWEHAKSHYRHADGTPTSTLDKCRMTIRPLRDLYGATEAASFGAAQLRAVRQQMIDLGWSRGVINQMVGVLRGMFRWAERRRLVPRGTASELGDVEPLRRGRSNARDTVPVNAVGLDAVEAVRPHVSNEVWCMIRLQLLTGARPGEIVGLVAADIDRHDTDVWVVRPRHHKLTHLGIPREILLGARAQDILRPLLAECAPEQPLFSPYEAERRRRAERHARRRTPLSCGNRPGGNTVPSPSRAAGDRYTTDSYARAIRRACDLAFPPPSEFARARVKGAKGDRLETLDEWRTRIGPDRWTKLVAWQKAHRWHPNQLRHTFATSVRRDFGIDAAQTALGHRLGSRITEIYASANLDKAREVARQVG